MAAAAVAAKRSKRGIMYILRGPTGSGKTTLARELIAKHSADGADGADPAGGVA